MTFQRFNVFLFVQKQNLRFIWVQVSQAAQDEFIKEQDRLDPVLPDELVVSLGESLTVVQQHDDGWCIVGRDSVFRPGEVELGAIPAWCFLKPVKGLRA